MPSYRQHALRHAGSTNTLQNPGRTRSGFPHSRNGSSPLRPFPPPRSAQAQRPQTERRSVRAHWLSHRGSTALRLTGSTTCGLGGASEGPGWASPGRRQGGLQPLPHSTSALQAARPSPPRPDSRIPYRKAVAEDATLAKTVGETQRYSIQATVL